MKHLARNISLLFLLTFFAVLGASRFGLFLPNEEKDQTEQLQGTSTVRQGSTTTSRFRSFSGGGISGGK